MAQLTVTALNKGNGTDIIYTAAGSKTFSGTGELAGKTLLILDTYQGRSIENTRYFPNILRIQILMG